MARQFDILIRQGLVVDGGGGEPFVADVALKDGRIAAIGAVAGDAAQEIDARGLIVTPGFVDVHTHYDGQAIWSERMVPSSNHGVTTVVMGNCGVGFAPCRPGDRDLLVAAMEGVEDIPEIVMTAGLTWEWESFAEFLDALDKRRRDIDVAAYIPHSALRVYVMGQRGADREPATDDDIAKMVEVVGVAMKAGAMGFATSRVAIHRRIDGEFIPSYEAAERELRAIAREVGRYGGVFQMVSEVASSTDDAEADEALGLIKRLSLEGATVTFSCGQSNSAPDRLASVMAGVAAANKEPGVSLWPQLFPRPIGLMLGFDLSMHPFMECPSYLAIAGLPFEQRLIELRKPEVRQRIVSEEAGPPRLPIMAMVRRYNQIYALGLSPDYEPAAEQSISGIARQRGVTPEEVAYDLMMEQGGRAILLLALANYARNSLDDLRDHLIAPQSVVALGDGGAHYGMVCDASYPTFMLSHWVRDREHGRFSVAEAIRALSSVPATMIGLKDRGLIEVGRKADINIIDLERVRVQAPTVRHDLPAGGKRLDQEARGYRFTIVNGRVISRDGTHTGELPGALVRRKSPARQGGDLETVA